MTGSKPFRASLPTTPVRWAFEAGAASRLKPEERHVLVALASRCTSHHWATSVSKHTIAEMTGLGRKVIADAVWALKRADLIMEVPPTPGSADTSEFRLKGQPGGQR